MTSRVEQLVTAYVTLSIYVKKVSHPISVSYVRSHGICAYASSRGGTRQIDDAGRIQLSMQLRLPQQLHDARGQGTALLTSFLPLVQMLRRERWEILPGPWGRHYSITGNSVVLIIL